MMENPLTIVVTGAAGFIGRAVVAAARAQGHTVRALVRRAESALPEWDEGVIPVVADLLSGSDLTDALSGADVVIHLAAKISGDAEDQRKNTVDATEALCAAMVDLPKAPRLVLISSIAVYAHDAVAEHGTIDENAALETKPEARDIYCQIKLAQEDIARRFQTSHALPLTILRPGAVFGPGNVWNAHMGINAGPVLVQFTRAGQLPVIYVKNCAQMILKACATQVDGPINLIDANPPDRAGYLHALGSGKPAIVLPWRAMAFIGAMLPIAAKPGLLHPAILQARMMPVNYSTTAAEALMDREDLVSFKEAMRISCEESS